MTGSMLTEQYATNILLLAVRNGQAKEFIETLWDGGSFTLDVEGKRLAFITADQIKAACGNDRD